MSQEEPTVKRQTIAPGVVMEKFQEKVNDQPNYVIRIELQLFQVLEFNIDFSGSSNVKLQGSAGLSKSTTVQPFSKTEVARLTLDKKWNLKTKFRFSIKLPGLEMQRKSLESSKKKLTALINLNEKTPVSDPEVVGWHINQSEYEFVDTTFPPTDATIDVDEATILSKYECLVDWRTSRQIATLPSDAAAGKWSDLPLYNANSVPSQIKSGKLENNWLQTALSAVADRQEFVKGLVTLVQGGRSNAYFVNLFEQGVRRKIVLDAYLPCTPLSGPIFTSTADGELWATVVEKAFAKLLGGYSALRFGQIKSGLVTLTNCPTFTYDLKDDNSALILRSLKFFNLIKEWTAKRYIVVAGTGAFGNLAESANAPSLGYSVINYLEIDHSKFPVPNNERATSRIVNLRNPWGVFEWAGDWSASSPLWTEQIKSYYADYLQGASGSFWISIENLLENFTSLTVCETQGWHCFSFKSAFVKCVETNNETSPYFSPKAYFELNLTEKTRLVFGVHQEDERAPGVAETRPIIDIGIVILSYADGAYRLERHIDSEYSRDVYLEVVLEPGNYLIVPKSVGVFLNPDQRVRQMGFDPKGKLERSIFGSIFDKFDQFNSGSFKPAEFEDIVRSLNVPAISPAAEETVTSVLADARQLASVGRPDFITFFGRIAAALGERNVYPFLKKFGFNQNYVCEGMRTFMFTLQSERELVVNVRDALADKAELIVFKLLLKNHGKAIDQRKTVSGNNEISDVECFYYFNE